ncbi:hypothetical protein EHQ30_10760 [Leptospira brenneri]|uniref:Uncharacterized protein n=1 Tax=Leptospira brenneri TaxID=2023182 RepID=A0A5F1ZC07_9LEPT|nr:hypothetical protein [Leptospira brenneri]TGK97039.1 hypothetical protein EHQ30_10760 [Leptospira brenneri]
MRKFPKTLPISISLEHLPMPETELKQICLEWEDQRFSFFRPAVVMEWKSTPLPLGKSSLILDLKLSLPFWQGLVAFLLPNWYYQNKKHQLTEILLDQIDSKNKKKNTNLFFKLWNRLWKTPVSIVWLNLGFIKISMNLDLDPKLLPNSHILTYDGEIKLYFRIGYLKTINYQFTKKEFKAPFPKFAEMYIKTRDKHEDKSLGKVYYSFLGYLLETKSDEYLLPYLGFNFTLPNSLRNHVPDEIWNVIDPGIHSLWIEPNLSANELEFRTVYQVSTSSQNHPK